MIQSARSLKNMATITVEGFPKKFGGKDQQGQNRHQNDLHNIRFARRQKAPVNPGPAIDTPHDQQGNKPIYGQNSDKCSACHGRTQNCRWQDWAEY